MRADNTDPAHEAISTAADIVGRRMAERHADAAAAFCRLFYAHAPRGDIAGVDPETLALRALSIFKLAASRDDAPLVRAYNPTLSDDGWQSGHTIVEIVHDDMPFLVDSITAEINRRGLTVHLIIHPVLRLTRKDGDIVEVAERRREAGDESVMQVHIDERTDVKELADLEDGLKEVLRSVRAAVGDWAEMRNHVASAIEDLTLRAPSAVDAKQAAEGADFLAWLDDDHFTFLGYREYAFSGDGDDFRSKAKTETGLGLLRADLATSKVIGGNIDSLPAAAAARMKEPRVLTVLKSASRSPVHRPTQLDYIAVQIFSESGEIVGERRFVGLFTSTVYTTSPRRIPILRQKFAEVVGRAGAGRGSHDEKALTHILETFPRDELLQIDVAQLTEIASGILNLQERQRTALFARRDAYDRFVSALVYVPRDRYDTDMRRKLGAILARDLRGEVASFTTHIGDDPLARVHFIVSTPNGAAGADLELTETRLQEASRSWTDRLESVLVGTHGGERGLALFRTYSEAFPQAYRDAFSAEIAAHDIELIEGETRSEGLGLDLTRPPEAADSEIHFKLFYPERPATLSDVLPMLEDLGLRILTETPNRIAPAGGQPIYIHHFTAETSDRKAIELRSARPKFLEGFRRIWRGEADSDDLNRLILSAGLAWRQVVLLRAFGYYLRQAAAPFSVEYMRATLNAHPEIAGMIVRYFEARFDPTGPNDGAAEREAAIGALDGVENLDEDRILRRFINLVDAALRTNFWQPAADGRNKPYISIKFDSAKVDDLPLPRPMAEIFVYSNRMEGVHLRGGKVARGGIRWSDRREDFRTEILGLMKAQMVKNTVIVPVGAKGGFIVKKPPVEGGREAFLAEGVECYKTLIRGMLDVTDNIVDGEIAPPPNVVRADGDDPYIVAAADKGTATFSDIANGISQDYGFWLNDAFASGGSAGYDHKKMGITARGAWESVKRMFLELGKDIQSEPFTVVGCGDMSGDVFGNGMLLSKQIKLVAAFNHMHILVDPDPDPAASWAERKRMFDLPRSAWSDYDKSTLSKGGAIFERSAKSLTLSSEAQAALGAAKATMTPNELINTILKAEVDLLWFGGIGNYVKSRDESNQDAGDRANDPVRVNGDQVRAKVIGEGANLGVTQLGRIEFAASGGRINTDFIDNSAGVDASDHEVNLKILLGRIVSDGDMTMKQRDKLLAEMTEEVARLILRNNYMQGQALSIVQRDAAGRLSDHIRFMRALERQNRLNRSVEFLPNDEALAEREAEGAGLTRPEIAILLSYAKLVLYDDLVASEIAKDDGLRERLLHYFPQPIQERYAEQALNHQLGGEITCTILTNEIVDRMGPTFVFHLADSMGRTTADVARAFAIVVDAFGVADLFRQVEALDGPGRFPLQAEMFGEITRMIRRATQWVLRRRGDALNIAAARDELRVPIQNLTANLYDAASPTVAENVAARTQRWIEGGADEDLAKAVAQMDPMAAVLDIVQIAREASDAELIDAARVYYAAGERLRLGWARRSARGIVATTAWERLAQDAILEDLYGHQAEIARRALAQGGVDAWVEARLRSVSRLEQTLDEMAAADGVTLAMATVANSLYRGLSAS